jgi:hypothetical protein
VKLALSEPFRYRSKVLITRRATGSLALIIVAVAAIINAKLPVNDALCVNKSKIEKVMI